MNVLPDFADILAPIRAAHSHRERMAGSLADIITDLINKNEPLLKATRDGTEITVAERGGPLIFTITVEPGSTREAGHD